MAPTGGIGGPAASLYFEEVLTELRRTRIATEMIAQALGHLIPHLVETGDRHTSDGGPQPEL